MQSAQVCRWAAEFNPPHCDSVTVVIPTNGVSCPKVVGGIRGYCTQTTDVFSIGNGIEGHYMDGLSLIYDQNPRNNMWSFASAARSARVISVPLPRFRWCCSTKLCW